MSINSFETKGITHIRYAAQTMMVNPAMEAKNRPTFEPLAFACTRPLIARCQTTTRYEMQPIAYHPHFCGVPSEPKAANIPVKIMMTSAMMAINKCAPFSPASKPKLIRIRGVVKLQSTYLAQKTWRYTSWKVSGMWLWEWRTRTWLYETPWPVAMAKYEREAKMVVKVVMT